MATAALHSVSAQDLAKLAYNGPPPGALTMSPGMYTVHNLAGQGPVLRKRKLILSRFEQAKRDLSMGREHEIGDRTKPAYYYTSVPVDDVIDKLGWWNPVACGRPKEFAFKLLLGVPSPASFKSFKWKMCGLTYFLPPIVGHSKSKSRTTVAGVTLLRHWGEQFPKFKPFFNAFYDPKAEREITLDCIDFALGYIPGHFMRVIEANARKEEECERKEIRQAQMYRMAQMQSAIQAQANSGLLAGVTGSGNLTTTATEVLMKRQEVEMKMDRMRMMLANTAPPKSVTTFFSTLLGDFVGGGSKT